MVVAAHLARPRRRRAATCCADPGPCGSPHLDPAAVPQCARRAADPHLGRQKVSAPVPGARPRSGPSRPSRARRPCAVDGATPRSLHGRRRRVVTLRIVDPPEAPALPPYGRPGRHRAEAPRRGACAERRRGPSATTSGIATEALAEPRPSAHRCGGRSTGDAVAATRSSPTRPPPRRRGGGAGPAQPMTMTETMPSAASSWAATSAGPLRAEMTMRAPASRPGTADVHVVDVDPGREDRAHRPITPGRSSLHEGEVGRRGTSSVCPSICTSRGSPGRPRRGSGGRRPRCSPG